MIGRIRDELPRFLFTVALQEQQIKVSRATFNEQVAVVEEFVTLMDGTYLVSPHEKAVTQLSQRIMELAKNEH